ncbi:MAG: hypothetical protein ACXW3D_09015 [Caulobacteraceae bacterium]
MKTLIAAAAALTFAAGAAQAATTVVHDQATGQTYIYQGKTYPRVHQAWVAPSGWTTRTYVVGEAVPEVIYANPAYVIDTAAYPMLPRHTSDTKWVRVGPDALLIRVGSGNVVERIENFYY